MDGNASITFRIDLDCTSAELVYGQTIRIPGEFFQEIERKWIDPNDYVARLKSFMQTLNPTNPRIASNKYTYVNKDLHNCTHVFLRVDSIKNSLHYVYDGPYKVIQRDDKTMVLEIGKRQETVSLDRVKPAYLDSFMRKALEGAM